MRTVAPRLAAGSIAAVLLLSGCGGSPDPSPLPKPTDTASPSASAAPVPPEMPAAAGSETKAGAKAAVQYFLAAMEYAGATGNTASFEASYTVECTRCQAITEGIRKTYADGGSIVGGAWRPTRFKIYAVENGVAYLDAVVDYDAQTWVKNATGDKSTSAPKRNVLKAFQLLWRDERWLVGALDPQF